MSSKKMSSRSFKVLPLIFAVSVTFFSYSIASVKIDSEKDDTMLLPETVFNETRYASTSTQPKHNKEDITVSFKSSEPEVVTRSEKNLDANTENRYSTKQELKHKAGVASVLTQNSMAGYNFLSNLFHRFTEITKSHNRMYKLRYKSDDEKQHDENVTANATTVTSSPSDMQTSRRHITSHTPANRKNNTDIVTTPGFVQRSGQSKKVVTGNHLNGSVKTGHSNPLLTPTVPANNISLTGTKNDSQKPCPKCRTRALPEEEVVTLRTGQFKELLLDKLRLSEKDLSVKPSRGFPKLPRDILEKTLRDNARQEAMEEFYAQDKELILDGRDLGRKCIKSRQVTGCFMFVLEGKDRGEVASAQLWLYKTPDGNDVSGQTVRVFQLEKTRRGRLRRRNLMIRQDTYVQEGWVTMNVTRSVRSWVDKRMQTAMMAIQCETCRTRNHKALYGAKDGYRPLLVIDYDTSVLPPRKRRTVENCDPRHECCKRNLELNFTAIGMPTVLFPLSMSIGYCFGFCNDPPQFRYNHTQLVQSVRFNDPSLNATMRSQLQPCCIPVTFKDTFLIIYTNQGLIQTTVPNVIVKSCGCV